MSFDQEVCLLAVKQHFFDSRRTRSPPTPRSKVLPEEVSRDIRGPTGGSTYVRVLGFDAKSVEQHLVMTIVTTLVVTKPARDTEDRYSIAG